jgi:hypothetical protein
VESKELHVDPDPHLLAVSVLTSLHGGLLLAEVTRQMRRLEIAFDAAIAFVRWFSSR